MVGFGTRPGEMVDFDVEGQAIFSEISKYLIKIPTDERRPPSKTPAGLAPLTISRLTTFTKSLSTL